MIQTLFGGWTLLVLIFLYLPILLLIVYSFNESRFAAEWKGFTFKWYAALLDDKVLMGTLRNSLIIAAFTTLISTVLGTLGAWLLYRYRFPAVRSLNTLLFIPMAVPEVIMGVSLLIFFATLQMNLSLWTVIISHVTFCFPFVLIAIKARLDGVDPFLEEAAMDLGAPPMKAFFLVMVPYLTPAIIAGALMSFTLSMDEVIVTYFVSGADSRTLPIHIYGLARKGLNPSLNAISALFVIATALLVVAAEKIRRVHR